MRPSDRIRLALPIALVLVVVAALLQCLGVLPPTRRRSQTR